MFRAITSFFQRYLALQPVLPPMIAGLSTYPLSKLTDDDKAYLLRMDLPYRQALKGIPGGHQIFFDILTDDAGSTWKDLGADIMPSGYAFQLRVNACINYADRIPHVYQWNPSSYTGPLRTVLGASLARQLKV